MINESINANKDYQQIIKTQGEQSNVNNRIYTGVPDKEYDVIPEKNKIYLKEWYSFTDMKDKILHYNKKPISPLMSGELIGSKKGLIYTSTMYRSGWQILLPINNTEPLKLMLSVYKIDIYDNWTTSTDTIHNIENFKLPDYFIIDGEVVDVNYKIDMIFNLSTPVNDPLIFCPRDDIWVYD